MIDQEVCQLRQRYPSYLNLTLSELETRAGLAEEMLRACKLCPRECGVDRTKGQRGYCKTGDKPFVSSWGPHFGEERPITGLQGSGTIFFGNCNLGCLFCQNWEISHEGEGSEISEHQLADIMLSLQKRGCHNINLVTPTHQMPMILRALLFAIEGGLSIPIVYNCGGYESLDALRLLNGIVDIYMPDLKFTDSAVSMRWADAPDYFQRAKEAIVEMYRQVGDLVIDKSHIAKRGLLIRHLVLPGGLAGTKEAMDFIARCISKNTFVNVMDQYYPCYKAKGDTKLGRRITREEYLLALECLFNSGIHRTDED